MTHQPSNATSTRGGLERLSRRLCSRRFVVILLTLLVVVCLAGVLIPQRSSPFYKQWQIDHPTLAGLAALAGLEQAFKSVPFLALVGLTALNITLYVLSRLKDLPFPGTKRGGLHSLLARRRLVGSLIFHGGLVGIMVAAVVSALTRSEGRIVLTEGQTVAIGDAQVQRVAPRNANSTASTLFQVRLDKFHPVHQGRFGTPDYANDLTVIEAGREVRRATVRVNEPLVHRGITFYQRVHGFAPFFVLSDAEGRPTFKSWVTLDTDLKADPVRYLDDFAIPGTRLSVVAEFFPDAYMTGNRLASRSPEPNNPAAAVTVRDGDTTIYSGHVYQGQPVELSNGFRLAIDGVRYWSRFNTVRDRGAFPLFVASWVAIAGLCVRFIPQRRGARTDD